MLFLKNAPLAWITVSVKVEGPWREGHSPALLASAQTTRGDYVCLTKIDGWRQGLETRPPEEELKELGVMSFERRLLRRHVTALKVREGLDGKN